LSAGIGNDGDGLIGGHHVGYNWQSGQTVFGLEGDYSANDDFQNYLASIRGRLGWASGRYLFYGTGGVAFSGGNDQDAFGLGARGGNGGSGGNGGNGFPDPGIAGAGGAGGAGGRGSAGERTRFGGGGDDETGWVGGLGVEAKLSRKVSAGLEGLYYAFDDHSGKKSDNADDDLFALRARLTYHLRPDGSLKDGDVVANWTGFYFGLNGGGLFGDGNQIDQVRTADGGVGGLGGTGGAGGPGDQGGVSGGAGGGGGGGGGGSGGSAALAVFGDDSLVTGGGHVGFNWQSQNWVYGIEGDIGAVEDVYDYVASLRGRVGWAADNVLLYATTGVAFARNDSFNGKVFVG
jgi:hypothetical protein